MHVTTNRELLIYPPANSSSNHCDVPSACLQKPFQSAPIKKRWWCVRGDHRQKIDALSVCNAMFIRNQWSAVLLVCVPPVFIFVWWSPINERDCFNVHWASERAGVRFPDKQRSASGNLLLIMQTFPHLESNMRQPDCTAQHAVHVSIKLAN
jgi:hypothetical protein